MLLQGPSIFWARYQYASFLAIYWYHRISKNPRNNAPCLKADSVTGVSYKRPVPPDVPFAPKQLSVYMPWLENPAIHNFCAESYLLLPFCSIFCVRLLQIDRHLENLQLDLDDRRAATSEDRQREGSILGCSLPQIVELMCWAIQTEMKLEQAIKAISILMGMRFCRQSSEYNDIDGNGVLRNCFVVARDLVAEVEGFKEEMFQSWQVRKAHHFEWNGRGDVDSNCNSGIEVPLHWLTFAFVWDTELFWCRENSSFSYSQDGMLQMIHDLQTWNDRKLAAFDEITGKLETHFSDKLLGLAKEVSLHFPMLTLLDCLMGHAVAGEWSSKGSISVMIYSDPHVYPDVWIGAWRKTNPKVMIPVALQNRPLL